MFKVGCVSGSLGYADLDEHLYGKWASLASHKIPHYQLVHVLPHDDILETYANELRGRYTSLRIVSLHDIDQEH